MKLNVIDARGRSCPEPVIMTKKAVEENLNGVQIMVDNTTAVENITRFGKNSGFLVEVKEKDDEYILTLKR